MSTENEGIAEGKSTVLGGLDGGNSPMLRQRPYDRTDRANKTCRVRSAAIMIGRAGNAAAQCLVDTFLKHIQVKFSFNDGKKKGFGLPQRTRINNG
jgi:hypothetical protein